MESFPWLKLNWQQTGSRLLCVLYLIDATVTETNRVGLRFLNEKDEIEDIMDDAYRPYFLLTHPLTEQEENDIRYFSGQIGTVEKTDLFTNEKRVFAKVCWPNPKIAVKAAERFSRCWESEIDFARSYVYDRGLAFGAPHSNGDLKPLVGMPDGAKERFDKTFMEMQSTDPLKYAQIAYWFGLLNQPVPQLNSRLLGVEETTSDGVYAAWMLSRIANIPLAEAFSSRRVSDWIRPIIHTYLRKNGILIPTGEELRRGKPVHCVTGALTVAPKAGTYFDTTVCDFESLYPSCIDSFNLSYETVDCPHAECTNNRIPDIETHVCMKRRGFYAILIGALKELRIKVFKPASKNTSLPEEERKVAEAAAKLLKLVLVSSYGVTVRIRGVACPPLAEAITGYGRYVLRESWKMAEEHGLRPLYGDTDSLFLDNPGVGQVELLIKAIKERFRLDLAVDKHYSMCVLPKAKKAYFGILADGTPDIKGVTAAKSNAPAYVTNVFKQCVIELSVVRDQEGYEQAKKSIRRIAEKAVADLERRLVKLDDLVYTVKLYADPNERIGDVKSAHQPYQCALQLIDAGQKLSNGDTVSFIKVKPFKYKDRTFSVKPAEFVSSTTEVNTHDYVRNLLTALNQTFEPMGIQLDTKRDTQISKWL